MADTKEKTEVKQTTGVKENKYYLTDSARNCAYFGIIDGRKFIIDYERNWKGEPNSRFASVGPFDTEDDPTRKEFKSDNKGYFEGLPPIPIRSLANAGVIKTKKADKDIIMSTYRKIEEE